MIKTREHALEVAQRYFDTKDLAEIAPHVRDLMTYDAERSFALMQGSGNEMDLFEQFVSLIKMHGFVTRDESLKLLMDVPELPPQPRGM